MPIRFGNKTRKNCLKHTEKCNKYAKKGTQMKCKLKSCRAKKYQSVYGSTRSHIRSNKQLFY